MIYRRALLDHAHAQCARQHALKRLRERFGIELDLPGLRSIEAGLVAGRYRWLAVKPGRQSIAFEVPIGAVVTYPIFNFRLLAVVTFLEKADEIRPAIGRAR